MSFNLVGLAQPGCSTPTTNPSCATALPLSVAGACVNGTTCSGNAAITSSCLYAGSECSWYSFSATDTDMYVNIDVTSTDGCHISSNVYEATGSCIGTEISCLSGTPLDDVHILTGLTIGTTYYVQVCYAPGGPCGNGGEAQFCILVDETDEPCNTCSDPCGNAQGYITAPTISQVVADCMTDEFGPSLQPGTTHRFCYEFLATNTWVDFNVIITSNCGTGGNVVGLTWDLYNSPSCGSAIQSGNLSSLTFASLTIGNFYVFCYEFTVPTTCSHSQHCPYFVGAIVLPVSWLGMALESIDDHVLVKWSTATERNNDHFDVERSMNGMDFHSIGQVEGVGESFMEVQYQFVDIEPLSGLSYYRIKQTDNDGAFSYHEVASIQVNVPLSDAMIVPNPLTDGSQVLFTSPGSGMVTLKIHDASGRLMVRSTNATTVGPNRLPLPMLDLDQGVYFISLRAGRVEKLIRTVKL